MHIETFVHPAHREPSTRPMPAFLLLVDARSGARREYTASPVRIGRDPEFELVLSGADAGVVSASHAILEHDGHAWSVTDLASRNGTYLNDQRLAPSERTPLMTGSVLRLGEKGPQFRVAAVASKVVAATMIESAVPRPVPALPAAAAAAKTQPLITSTPPVGKGAKGAAAAPGMRTLAFEKAMTDERARSSSRVRTVGVAAGVVILVAVGGVLAYGRVRARQAEEALAARTADLARQEKVNDSLRVLVTEDAERLRLRLAAAESAGGNALLVDSLNKALLAANQRSAELESSLQRAQKAVAMQQAAVDSVRRASSTEIERLKGEVAKAGTGKARTRDSLQKKLEAVQAQVAEVAQIDAKVKASGANLAALAQASGPSVGAVTCWFGTKGKSASGVVVSASGIALTPRTIMRDGETEPDSIMVLLGGAKKALVASEIAVGDDGPDIAIIQIDDYAGPFVKKVDWKGTTLRAGDAITILGMPAGTAAGSASVLRATIAAGVLGAIAGDQLFYEATTAVGGSGSAVFNAAGDLVAIHGARGTKGYTAVPLKPARKMLPQEIRKELAI